MDHMKTIKILICSFLLCLSSCTTLHAPSSLPLHLSWEERENLLNNMNNWKIQGVLGVRTPHDSGSATLSWKQTPQRYTIALFGPLGTGAIQIEGKAGRVTLDTPQGKRIEAHSPEALLRRQTGWDVPVSSLYYWVRGLPVPGPSRLYFDQYHRLTALEQQQWRVEFQQYAVFRQRELPIRIVLTHPALNIKIIIYQWNTG